MRKRAYASSRSMTWERIAERYLAVFDERPARAGSSGIRASHEHGAPPREQSRRLSLRIDHFLSMCDDTGLFQHAVHSRAGSLPWLLRG